MRLTELRGDVVILACAVSAGVHGALAPQHFDESTEAGFGFVAATLLLAGLVVWLTRRPSSASALAAAATVLGGLLASYALAATTGLPGLHPEPEPVDGVALVTKAIEAAGLLAASSLLGWQPAALVLRQPKGTPT